MCVCVSVLCVLYFVCVFVYVVCVFVTLWTITGLKKFNICLFYKGGLVESKLKLF